MNTNLKSYDENSNPQNKQKAYKVKEFKEYLVKSDLLLAFLKFMLSIRQMKDKPKDPLLAFQEFFQTYRDPSWVEFEQLQQDLQDLVRDSQNMQEQIISLTQDIENRKRQIEEEKKIKQQEEEEMAKNSKDKKNKK